MIKAGDYKIELTITKFYIDGTSVTDDGNSFNDKQLHRLDGPAMIMKSNYDSFIEYRYFLFDKFICANYGKPLSKKKWNKIKNKHIKEMVFK